MFEEYKKLLKEIVKFKSVSTDPQFKGEIEKMVLWLQNLFKTNGFNVKIWRSKKINPVVFASYKVSQKAETIMIYGHYDVQPAEKEDGWKGEPFELSESKTKLFARGVIDNKGQVLIHIATVIHLIKEKKLKYNINFMLEGNEETGNVSLGEIMAQHKKEVACDVVVVSDGEMTNNKPTIEVSLRGGFNCTLTYRTGKNTVHSGIWGGAIPNSAYELSKFIAKLYDQKNTLTYKDFYNGIDKITPDQVKNNKSLIKDGGDIASLAGVKQLLMEPNLDFYTQTGLRTTVQVTGLKAGYIGEGYANIVPPTSEARLNFRLAASQKASVIANSFEKFVKLNTPKYVDYKIEFDGLHDPVKVNVKNKYVALAETAMSEVYKTRVNRRNVGGAIPFVGDVKKILGVDTVLIPLVNEDCNMHGANENFDISLAKKALEFSRAFLSE